MPDQSTELILDAQVSHHVITKAEAEYALDREEFDVPAGLARRGDTTYVYHRDICLRCGSPILTVELGGRACYYCPVDQPF